MKRLWIYSIALLCCLACFVLSSCRKTEPGGEAANVDVTRGDLNLSSFTARGLEGGVYSGTVFQGHRLTMMNVWGTYCSPCIRELPDLDRLSKEYGEEFQLIGVVIDAVDRNLNVIPEIKEEAKNIASQTGASYLQLLPSRSLNDLFLSGVQATPVTLFLDESGVILGKPVYGNKDYDGWKKLIDAYLAALSTTE